MIAEKWQKRPPIVTHYTIN